MTDAQYGWLMLVLAIQAALICTAINQVRGAIERLIELLSEAEA